MIASDSYKDLLTYLRFVLQSSRQVIGKYV